MGVVRILLALKEVVVVVLEVVRILKPKKNEKI